MVVIYFLQFLHPKYGQEGIDHAYWWCGTSNPANLGATLHLHLAVRLFIASSGSYDPLIRNYSINPEPQVEEEVVSMKDFELAQYASYTEQWPHFGIKSTKEFLEQLFEL